MRGEWVYLAVFWLAVVSPIVYCDVRYNMLSVDNGEIFVSVAIK